MIDEKIIKDCLSELRSRQAKYKVYERYFNGEHDILYNYAMQDARSNMKVVVNFPRRFILEEVSYVLSNPVNFISFVNDTDLINLIDLNFSHWSKVHDQELLKQSQIFGESYELQYINKDGEFRATVLNPLNCYVLEDETADRNVLLALHLYNKKFVTDKEFLDVYLPDRILHYELKGDNLTLIGENTHIFKGVPINVMQGNAERKSEIDDIKSLNDAYNNVISDLVNECSDFRNAFFTIVGAEVEEADLLKMKKSGVIQVPAGASVNFLIKNLNDSFIQNLLTTIEEKIYQIASHINNQEKMQSNTSSLAMRSRLISLENKCSLMQSQLEVVIKQRLKRFFEYIELTTNQKYDYRTIKIKFSPNVPTDLAAIAQVITQLQNTISQKTALSLLPFVENPEAELEQFMKEKELYEGINLDGVVLNE